MIWMLLPDCVDYGEKNSSYFPAAITQSIVTFSAKLFGGMGIFVTGMILSSVNFEPNSISVSDLITEIFVWFKFLPIFLALIISIFTMRYYEISRNNFI